MFNKKFIKKRLQLSDDYKYRSYEQRHFFSNKMFAYINLKQFLPSNYLIFFVGLDFACTQHDQAKFDRSTHRRAG